MSTSNSKYAKLNQEVNEMAYKLVEQNPTEINGIIAKRLQEGIINKLFGIFLDMFEEDNGLARYWPPIKKYVPTDVFTEVLLKLLGTKDGTWRYNPTKGKFVTAFNFHLNNQTINYYHKNKRSLGIVSLQATIEMNDGKIKERVLAENEHSPDPCGELMKKMTGLAVIIEEWGKTLKKNRLKEQTYYS